jgi:hypothetical protein
MFWVRSKHIQVTCGCFGPGGSHVGPQTILRNLALIGLAVAGAGIARETRQPIQGSPLWTVAAAISAELTVLLLVALRETFPNLILDPDRLYERET